MAPKPKPMNLTPSSTGHMVIKVDRFEKQLAGLLHLLATADFIAIDLETSGTKEKLATDLTERTLEQVYNLISTNASGFGSLQLGLTVARWEDGEYATATFTIPISPLVAADTTEKRDLAKIVNRQTGVSQQALSRMVESKLTVDETFDEGVPYLSRAELKALDGWPCIELHAAPGIEFTLFTAADQDALKHLRIQIAQWAGSVADEGKPLSIYEPRGGAIRATTVRIVKSILYDEDFRRVYWVQSSECITVVGPSFKPTTKEQKEAIREQTGLSYLMEGLMSDSRLRSYTHMPGRPTGSLGWGDAAEDQALDDFSALLTKVENGKSILVGHNVLHDLCFLYAMFVGPLSYNLQEFTAAVNKVFPRVLDTAVLVAPVADAEQPLRPLSELAGSSSMKTASVGVKKTLTGERSSGQKSFDVMTLLLKQASKLRNLTLSQETAHTNGPFRSSQKEATAARLPGFDGTFWTPYANRVRAGNAGVLNLDSKPAKIKDGMPCRGMNPYYRTSQEDEDEQEFEPNGWGAVNPPDDDSVEGYEGNIMPGTFETAAGFYSENKAESNRISDWPPWGYASEDREAIDQEQVIGLDDFMPGGWDTAATFDEPVVVDRPESPLDIVDGRKVPNWGGRWWDEDALNVQPSKPPSKVPPPGW